jgi:hypothetical protein
MMSLSPEMIRSIQNEYEREAEQIYLRKLIPRTKSPFVRRLEWLAKDVTYLAFRLVARKRTSA